MNFSFSKRVIAQLTDGHKVLGLAMSAILFLICMSGTIAVFYKEIERWEKPQLTEFHNSSHDAVANAIQDSQQIMAADKNRDAIKEDLFLNLPNRSMPRMVAAYDDNARAYNQTGQYVGSARHDNTHFLSELHYYLHLPKSFGMILVSIFGIFMLALLLGGAFSHRKMFVDAFRLRAREKGQLGRVDLHNRIGTWTLPFTLVVTATGSFIGFSQIIVFLVATFFYAGDIDKTMEPMVGKQVTPQIEQAYFKPIDKKIVLHVLEQMTTEKPDEQILLITLNKALSKAPYFEVMTEQKNRLVFGEVYRFDEHGNLQKSQNYASGEAGKQIYASLFPLHFGSFGGIFIQLLYVFVGLALCLMIHAGMEIWFTKSANRGSPKLKLHVAWICFVYSCISSIFITMCFGLLGSPNLVTIYWATLITLIAIGTGVSSYLKEKIATISLAMKVILGFSMLALVATHLLIFQSFSQAAIWPNLALGCIGIYLLNIRKLRQIISNEMNKQTPTSKNSQCNS